jgi:hypothetical protein
MNNRANESLCSTHQLKYGKDGKGNAGKMGESEPRLPRRDGKTTA